MDQPEYATAVLAVGSAERDLQVTPNGGQVESYSFQLCMKLKESGSYNLLLLCRLKPLPLICKPCRSFAVNPSTLWQEVVLNDGVQSELLR